MSMNSEQLCQILQDAFPNAQVHVTGQSGKFDLRIVDSEFEGKRTLLRQQAVYVPIQHLLFNESIHAVNIRAMTPEEWRKASLFGV